MTMKLAAACLIATVVGAAPGCSQSTGPQTMRVWGDVTYDGRPIDEGTIDFISPDGAAPAQGAIKDGRYDVPATSGPVADKTYVVQINSLKKTGKTIPNMMGDGSPTMEISANVIPQKYNAQSTLTASVSADSSKNQFDFKLEKVGETKRR